MFNEEKYVNVLDTIYNEIFKSLRHNVTDVFLCGGASDKNNHSTRDKIKNEIKLMRNIRILYPEELFMDILNSNKGHDLLSLEQLLADNCDRICIVCESVGSFVELGAFTNNVNTFDKVIALVQTKFKNQKSFLMLGPIKYIKSKNKENVIFYNNDISLTVKKLRLLLKQKKDQKNNKGIDTIIGMHYFILLMLYFFREIDVESFIVLLKKMLSDKKAEDKLNFNLIFNPAMKLLYKERLVEKIKIEDKEFYKITIKGKKFVKELISKIYIPNKHNVLDKIRLDVIKSTYY